MLYIVIPSTAVGGNEDKVTTMDKKRVELWEWKAMLVFSLAMRKKHDLLDTAGNNTQLGVGVKSMA